MNVTPRLFSLLIMMIISLSLSAQNYKADRLRKAVEILGLQIEPDSLMPDTSITMVSKDGRVISLRTSAMGEIEHIGVPLFNDVLRILQPSPVYDFLEYAVLNWKYHINPNLLYLSKVIFKLGDWNTLIKENLIECSCSIENRDDKLYIVSWQRDAKDVAIIGIPIEYELLNNDSRRNMEQTFVKSISAFHPTIVRKEPQTISEDKLSIYGTEGLFVIPGQTYIIDLLNQNVYYKLTTIYETTDTIIHNKPVKMTMEAVLPVVVNDPEFPVESFANLMMCDDLSVPDVNMELVFHLSNYHREHISLPLSKLKAYCRQQGCNMFFACNGIQADLIRGVMFASNLPKGYNHLFSIRIPTEQLTSATPTVQADVYLYIPPVSKEKLFGTAPTKKSGVNFKMP